jgi:heme/copper-type cytochrome/quinol oxidase subunit 3
MFFFAFFWAFFHSSIAPVFNIGGVWPPKAITPMDTYTIPLTNTFFLLTSGATVTWAHHALVARAKKQALLALIFTLVLASLFTSLQGLEYVEATFNISDGIYGSCFYMATGFHGFHVFVGTIALFVSFVRIIFNHFTDHHHFGFESAIWYWHFVDVVWLFLFINVYWWSNSGTDLLPTPTGNVLELKSTPIIGTASWLFSTISDEDFIILKVYLLLDFFLEILSVLIFFCLIIFNIKTKLFFKDLLKFGSTLPFINKIALYIFTAAYAVPNRIWINHGINSYIVTLLVFLLFFFSNTFPVLTLVVVNYSALIVESLLVAYLYTGNSAFKSFIDKTLFANDSSRAKAYFSFFWGS